MAVGKIKSEKDLSRFIDKHLQNPGVLPAPQAPIALVKSEGVPADTDFPQAPLDRTLAISFVEGEPVLYVRLNDEWLPI